MQIARIYLVDQVEFPQGIGKSKKDARAAAARHAMACLLDIQEEQLNHQFLGTVINSRRKYFFILHHRSKSNLYRSSWSYVE